MIFFSFSLVFFLCATSYKTHQFSTFHFICVINYLENYRLNLWTSAVDRCSDTTMKIHFKEGEKWKRQISAISHLFLAFRGDFDTRNSVKWNCFNYRVKICLSSIETKTFAKQNRIDITYITWGRRLKQIRFQTQLEILSAMNLFKFSKESEVKSTSWNMVNIFQPFF